MQRRHRADVALRVVWSEFDAVGLGDDANLLHLGDAAAVNDVGLHEVDKVTPADFAESPLREEALSGG